MKTKKTFNAFIDRLVNLDFDELNEVESEEHLNDNSVGLSQGSINNSKSDKFH